MACKIFRNKENEIVKVEAPNKKESLLYKAILESSEINGDKELAIRQWVTAYLDDYKKKFGDWENNPDEFVGELDVNGEPTIESMRLRNITEKVDITPKTTEETVRELINNANFIKLTEDQKQYVNTKTGKKYHRVTSFLNNFEEVKSNPILESSQIIGTKVDELTRDYFDDKLKDLSTYDVSNKTELKSYLKALGVLKKQFDDAGETVLANDIVLYNDELGIAGTVDLLTYDKNGEFRIYDMKTMRGNNFTEFYRNDSKSKYDTTRYGKSKRQKHNEQLSLYRILLNNTHGVKAVKTAIIPIIIKYNAGDTSTSELRKLPTLETNFVDSVNGAKLDYFRRLKDVPVGDNNILEVDEKWAESKRNIILKSITEIVDDNYDSKIDLTTVDGRLTKVYNKLQDTINHQFRLIKRLDSNNKEFQKNKQQRIEEFQKLTKTIENYRDVNKLKGVLTYLEHAQKSITTLENSLRKKDKSKDDVEQTIKNFESYKTIFNIIDDISELYHDSIRAGHITPKPDILKQIKYIKSTHSSIEGDISGLIKDYLRYNLNDIKNFSKVEADWKERLEIEYNKTITQVRGNKGKAYKEKWINKKLQEFKPQIQRDVNKATNALIDNTAFDISVFSKSLMSGLEINSDIVQMFTGFALEVRDKIIADVTVVDGELDTLFKEYTKTNGSYNPRKQFKDIIEVDSKGNHFFKGRYKTEFMEKHYELQNKYSEISELKKKLKDNRTDKALIGELKGLKKITKALKDDLYISTHYKVSKVRPKWLNDFSKVSESNMKVLNEAYNRMETANINTHGFNSLVMNVGFVPDTLFYKMPSITASDFELVQSGNAKGLIVDKFKDLTTIKPDDIGHHTIKTNSSGEVLKELPIHFRGKIDPKTQSWDIFTMLKMESHNGIAYKHRADKEIFMNMVIDMVSNKNFYVTKGTSVTKQFSKYAKHNKEVVKKGDSNIEDKLRDIMDTFMYDITKKDAGKLGGVDIQKLTGMINGYTGMIGMSMNYHSALVNLAGGYAQFIISAVAKDVINVKDLTKAFAVYHKNTIGNAKDLNSASEDSFVSKINVMFDTFGGQKIGTESFIKDKGWKKFANLHGLTFMHSLGEHQLQSILTMAVLNSTKALDNSGDVIKEAGKELTVLDAIKLEGGKLKMNPKLVYTSHSPLTRWEDGGRVQMQSKIKYKMMETLGRYDNNHKSEFEKTWLGSLLFMYKRYFLSMGVSRWRNFGHSIKEKDNIDDDSKFYSNANKRYEEGYYTTAARFLLQNVIKNAKILNLKSIITDYNKLTDYDKGNIKKATIEAVLAQVIGITATLLAQAADEDDDELLFFLAYEMRRLESELWQFRDPNEAVMITKSSFASMRTLESSISLLGKIASPSTWSEEYETGRRKGQKKITKVVQDLVPLWNRTDISNEEKFNYLDNVLTK